MQIRRVGRRNINLQEEAGTRRGCRESRRRKTEAGEWGGAREMQGSGGDSEGKD
jgi:hypothetical protein